ncbi:MAG TPA: ATP-binding protein [Longimicrobiales bacterium]
MTVIATPATGDASILELAERFRADLPAAVRPALEQALEAHAAALAAEIQAFGRAAAAIVSPLALRGTEEAPPTGAALLRRIRQIDEARLAIGEHALAFVRSDARRTAAADAERVITTALAGGETVGAGFTPLLRVPQEEPRFYPQRGDSRGVRWLKAVKRLFRPLRRHPMRSVPAAALARFHATASLTERLVPVFGGVRCLHAAALRAAAHQLYMAVEGLDGLRRATLDGAPPQDVAVAAAALRDALLDAGRDEAQRLRRLGDQARHMMDAALDDLIAAFEADIVRIGTLELLPRAVSDARRHRLLARAAERGRRLAQAWERYDAAVGATLEARATLTRIGALAALAAGRAAAGIRAAIEDQLLEPTTSLARGLATARAACAEVLSAGPGGDSSMTAARDQVESLFARHRTLLEGATPVWADLDSPLDILLAELARLPAGAPESVRILTSIPAAASWEPPRLRRYRLRPRQLARIHVDGRLGRAAIERIRAVQPDLEGIRTDLRNARKAVVFHFAAAAALPANGDEDENLARLTPPEHIIGVLDRAAQQIEELGRNASAIEDALAAYLLREGGTTTRRLFTTVMSGPGAMRVDLYRERLLRLRGQVRRAVRGAGAAGAAAGARLRRAALALWRARRDVRERMGLEANHREAASADLALLEERTLAGLPDGYHQIFTLEPIDSDEFLVGREADLQTIAAAARRFDAGQPTAVAVLGEKGSGKTSLVRAAVRRVLPGRPLHSLELHRLVTRTDDLLAVLRDAFGRHDVGSLAELAELLRHGPPQVAIIEDAHRLFHRRVGGFDALRAFLAFAADTKPNVLWIATMDQYAWAYLDQVVGIGRYFELQIRTTNLPPAVIEQAILARHEVSGYALRFEPGERLVHSRRFGALTNESARQAEARRAFLADLTRVAEGNVFVALFTWLRSIAAVEGRTLVLRGPRAIETSFLQDFPLDALHTAAAVILHDGLGVEEHAACFQLSPEQSRLVLAGMADARLLFRADDGTYRINKVLYRPFVRLLRDRNLF